MSRRPGYTPLSSEATDNAAVPAADNRSVPPVAGVGRHDGSTSASADDNDEVPLATGTQPTIVAGGGAAEEEAVTEAPTVHDVVRIGSGGADPPAAHSPPGAQSPPRDLLALNSIDGLPLVGMPSCCCLTSTVEDGETITASNGDRMLKHEKYVPWFKDGSWRVRLAVRWSAPASALMALGGASFFVCQVA
jgi:hypothetical protein